MQKTAQPRIFTLTLPPELLSQELKTFMLHGTINFQTYKSSIMGGFVRDLFLKYYYQKRLEQGHPTPKTLNPDEIIPNDIDIFAATTGTTISVSELENMARPLTHIIGPFIDASLYHNIAEPHWRALCEFEIPEQMRQKFGGASSVQYNFGPVHPYRTPEQYLQTANLGINQIALLGLETGVIAFTEDFFRDVHGNTLTLNNRRPWHPRDLKRTMRKAKEMSQDKSRPHFLGSRVIVPEDLQILQPIPTPLQKPMFMAGR